MTRARPAQHVDDLLAHEREHVRDDLEQRHAHLPAGRRRRGGSRVTAPRAVAGSSF